MAALNLPEPNAFDAAIAPMDREEFITRHWGETFLRVPGDPHRFEGLMSWDDLNRLLQLHPLHALKLKLSLDDEPLDLGKYTFRQGSANAPTLSPATLSNCLAAGATMILDHVDEVAPGPRRIAIDFERALKTHTSINLYASWRAQPGFDLHWDGQDAFIFQLEGRKRWSVFEPTLPHPLKRLGDQPRPPGAEPVWEGLLERGDLLYLPRGWWHRVCPVGEPSLHLTVSLEPVHGGDLLDWFVEQLCRRPEVRKRIPRLANPDEISVYMQTLRATMLDEWTGDLATRYLEDLDGNSIIRPEFDLPRSVAPRNAALGPDSRLRPVSPRGLSISPAGEPHLVEVRSLGRRLQAPRDIAPALALLNGACVRPVRELCDQLPPEVATGRLMVVLAQLVLAGMVVLE